MEIVLIQHLASSIFGGFCQELAHWNSIKSNITNKKYTKLIKSRAYWVISLLMIVSSPIFLYLWVAGDFSQVELKTSFIYGVSFPLILKKLGETLYKDKITLGPEDVNFSSIIKSYLRVVK